MWNTIETSIDGTFFLDIHKLNWPCHICLEISSFAHKPSITSSIYNKLGNSNSKK